MFGTSYGWYARGSGYASTVTEEGWQHFRQRVARSRTMLDQLESVAGDEPAWYAGMLSIALAQGWEQAQFDALFQKAVRKFPHYLAYYFTKGSFYSAKWHGSSQAFATFVEESVNNTQNEMGQTLYARLHWSAQENGMFDNGKTDWARMRLGFETMVKHFPDDWNRNNFAKFACRARDWKTLLEQMEHINGRLTLSAWGSLDYVRACEAHARAALQREGRTAVRADARQ